MLLAFAPGTDLSALWKAYIHGHYRRHPKTGQQVWVDSYSDKRPEKHRAEFAHWQHRIEHVKDHLAQGHTREALHAFHDLGHDDSHKLARDLGLHDDGPDFADKKTLMGAIHGRLLAKKHELQAQVGRQVKADFEKRKAAGTVGRKVGKAPPTKDKDAVTMSKEELIAEHEKLVAVLKSPDHADDLKEAKEQEQELKGYKQGPVVVFKKPTPALASSADGATLDSDRGGAPQAPATGAKPMQALNEDQTLALRVVAKKMRSLGKINIDKNPAIAARWAGFKEWSGSAGPSRFYANLPGLSHEKNYVIFGTDGPVFSSDARLKREQKARHQQMQDMLETGKAELKGFLDAPDFESWIQDYEKSREVAGGSSPQAPAIAAVEWPSIPAGKQVMRVRVPEGSHAKTKDEVRHLVDFGSLKLVEPFRDFRVDNLVNYYDMMDDVDEVHVLGNDGKIFTFKQ